ncbi:efflux RND transporter periplasmic adaptor subunit [Noviherbaspirillum sedimenti]|uniref:Efflux RND transporter periplasmic adaptor subunit n=1 Tax=Noviherbaspirillum sedimenti TaxID=2320865 RepID=A0A3A3GAI8_9BURK|nr:efflux RND transporter periplasmic adaptor subunit [Noviherbaspirillum sedimenti]RJG03779.1 efflux RND transporter periplasmic adaptor subunit [Noviherbaspirillum sedimenti]
MNRLRKWWVWIVVLLLVILAASGYWMWAKNGAEPQYKTGKIEQGEITASVSASGTLSPVVSVQVGSQVSGQLKEIYVDFNSEVKQGQLIARIDPETFEYKVRQAQADLDAARAQVLTQQAQVAAQQAQAAQVDINLAEAKRDLDQKQQLTDKGFISAAERDKARAVYHAQVEQANAARAQVRVAQAGNGNAQAAVKQREAALAQARIELERTAIKAPVNGVVIKRSVERGQTVAASLQAPELFIIAENLSDMRVDTAIDESEIGRIRTGQKASFTVDAFPGRTFEGRVNLIRKSAQNVSNVVTYMVEVDAPNPRKELLPGMTANVRVVTDTRSDVLKVPNAALRFRPPGAASQRVSATDTAGASRQNNGQTAAQGRGQNNALREQLEKDLQLSEEQKGKLDAIFAGMRDKMAAAREAPQEERQKIMERSRSDMRAQIAAILTPEQRKKYEDLTAEQAGRRGTNTAGRVYVMDERGQPKEVPVRVGLTDGTMTEVMAPDLKAGMAVITGVAQSQVQAGSKPAAAPGPRMF